MCNALSTFDFHQSVIIYILVITKQMQENQILQKYFFLINLFIFIPFKKKSILCKKLIINTMQTIGLS